MRRCVWSVLAILLFSAGVQAGRTVIGEKVDRRLETPHPYAQQERAEPALVWSQALTHAGATYIAPHFSRFELAPGDYAVVRSPDGKQIRRYRGLGRAGLGLSDGGFWSGHIKGDTAIVELYAGSVGDAYGFDIDNYARGYTVKEIEEHNPGQGGNEPEAICGSDDAEWAPCYAASEPEVYDQARSVARLIIGGQFGCTGWMVGCEGHMMTNNHCIGNQNEANNTDYEFMAEGATCQSSCFGFGACPGVVEAQSATLVQTNGALDYSLLLLPENYSETYGYMQLRAEGPQLGERIYIPQHAAAWGKRIAIDSTHPADGSGFCEVQNLNSPPCSGGPGDIGYYCDTQGGSSGAPVLAWSDRRVVALHHCANCPNRGLNISDVIASLGGNVPACALEQLAGTVELDRPVYSCADSLTITVRDDSLAEALSTSVSVHSASETISETVVLQPIGAGVFSGSIPTTADAESADGALSLAHDDVITVEYLDADDGQGGSNVLRSVSASADCQGPGISKVDASDVTGSAATITWDTDEPADGLVVHGADTTVELELLSSHQVRVRGLAECSTQTFSVTSTDVLGNAGTDDNGGLLYSIDTGKDTQPEIDSVDTPLAIPDGDGSGAESTISVTDDETVIDVNVLVHVTHSFDGDLRLELTAPDGTTLTLADHLGSTGQNYDGTVFDDEAAKAITAGFPPFSGAYRPEQPLSAADGLSAAGDWTFRAIDDDNGDTGVIESWTLILTYPAQFCGPSTGLEAPQTTDDACAGGDGGGNGIWEAGEQVSFGVTLTNDGSDPLSGIGLTVVPLDAGASMLVDASTVADLAVGQSASSGPAQFVVQIDDTLACGTELAFELLVSADQGSWSRPFGQAIGNLVPFAGLALSEDFEAGLPSDWSVVDGLGDGNTWFADNHDDGPQCGNIDPVPPVAGTWAAADSDCAGQVAMDEQLISPLLDLSSAVTVGVEFDHYFNRYGDELADVDVRSSLTGGNWLTLARFTEDSANSERVSLDLTAYAAGAADVEIRWRYHDAQFDWFWYVDNVLVRTTSGGFCGMDVCAGSADEPTSVPTLAASRVDSSGTSIQLDWDDQCLPTAANLIYGPLDQVASYGIGGSVCGLTNPDSWDSVPAGSLWFLIVGDNGLGVEGSWGEATSGERNGAQASGECGVTSKSVNGVCR